MSVRGAPSALARPLSSPKFILPALTIAGVLGAMELLSRLNIVSTDYFPPVSTVARGLVERVQDPTFWIALGQTMQGWFWGLALAVAVGVPAGLLLGMSSRLNAFTRVIVEALRPLPPVALLPVVVLIFGINLQMKIYLVAFASLWPILIQTRYGVLDVDPVATATARAYGLGRTARFFRIVLPSASAYIATGLRVSAVVALSVGIATEMIIGSQGLGNAINSAQYASDAPKMYALIVVSGLVGWFINIGIRSGERRLLHWHTTIRKDVPA